jgi:hypothetical protein
MSNATAAIGNIAALRPLTPPLGELREQVRADETVHIDVS